jgi:hypothetical protein
LIVAPDDSSAKRRFAKGRAIGEIDIAPQPDSMKSLASAHSAVDAGAAHAHEIELEQRNPLASQALVTMHGPVTVGAEPPVQPRRRGRPKKAKGADYGSSNAARSVTGAEHILIAPAAIADANVMPRDTIVFDAMRALYLSASPRVQALVKEMVRA